MHEILKGAWYLSMIPMDLGASMGALYRVILTAATFSLNYLDLYDDLW